MKSSVTISERITAPIAAALFAFGLAGCGSGGGSSGDGAEMGEFSLSLTDAPFTAATVVKVTLNAVHLKPADNDTNWVRFDLPPQTIDLMTLQGMATAELVDDLPVPAGDYREIRLLVDESKPENNEIFIAAGGNYSLTIPSGSSSGLKIKGNFTVGTERPTKLIADIDLLQSLVLAGPGDYRLHPVIRLVEHNSAGHLRGTVDAARLDGSKTKCSDGDPNSYNAVYVYSGHDADVEDIDQSETDDDDQPLTTTTIKLDPVSGDYVYEVAFLPPGDYTLAFTCKADLEILDSDDDLSFFDVRDVTVLVSNVLFL